jgi:hypothetical protein
MPAQVDRLSIRVLNCALKDYEQTQWQPVKVICSTLRLVAVQVFNTAFGLKRSQMVRKPTDLWRFGWERKDRPKTADDLKRKFESILGGRIKQKDDG